MLFVLAAENLFVLYRHARHVTRSFNHSVTVPFKLSRSVVIVVIVVVHSAAVGPPIRRLVAINVNNSVTI